jgi:hypothetical protein
MGDVAVHRVISEKLFFFSPRVLHRHILHDVLLAPVDHADKAQLEGVCPPGEHVERVGPGVHEVEFREHAERAETAWVYAARELQGVGVGEVDVGGGYSEDDPGQSARV